MRRSTHVRAAASRATGSASNAALYLARYLEWYPPRQSPDLARIVRADLANRRRYRAVAPPYGVICVDPHAIEWRITVHKRTWPLGLVHGGEWDRDLREPVDAPGKLASMWQRYRLGLEWEETDIFRRTYSPVLARGGTIKGAATLDALAEHYRRAYDGLYHRIAEQGFKVPTLRDPRPSFVYVHIGRAGELLFTSGGHHRLGIALALGLRSIPVRVLTRHVEWQRAREAVKHGAAVPADVATHPDMRDLQRHRPTSAR